MKILLHIIMIILIVYLAPCFSQELPEGPYFGEEPPGQAPKKFAPNFISTSDRAVQNGSFSPDGKEFCFSVSGTNWVSTIMITRQIDSTWTEPEVISFAKTARGISNACPVYSPDGQKIYFISRGRQNYRSADIWVSNRHENDWAAPSRLRVPVNSDADEWEVCISQNNTLYFSSSRSGGYGSMDVYRSKLEGGQYRTVQNLGPQINTSSLDECPAIAADESFLFFNSWRGGGYGGNDLYFSIKNSDGSWSQPKNLGPELNTWQLDIYPVLTPDGKYFLFTRRMSASVNSSAIYWVNAPDLIEFMKTDNYPPYLAKLLPDTTININEWFEYKVPPNTFTDKEGELIYKAQLVGGNPLPDWITFNPDSITFEGNPTETGSYNIEVIAKDDDLASVSDHFLINVINPLSVKDSLSFNHFELYQNYPNPFNQTTKISYSIPKSGYVTLKVYDMLGQEIQTPLNNFQTTGNYNVTFDAKNLSSGIYFYKLQVGNSYLDMKEMILMR